MQPLKTIVFRGIRPTDPDGRKGLRNPERGLRLETVIARTEDDLIKWPRKWKFQEFADDGVTLTQAYCYLTQYWNKPIAREKLDALEADFAEARRCGIKFLLRFAYENDAHRLSPNTEGILRHMAQLKPVLDRNWDVIYALQSGWVGLWGEFHTSIQNIDCDPRACAEIVRKTIELLPEDRFTMMRYPKRRRQVFQSWGFHEGIASGMAFSQALPAKVGFFNDGTLADPTDGGTFADHPLAGAPGNPDFDFITQDAPYMPVDGELFWNHTCDAKYASGEKAIARFYDHHYTSFSYVHGFSLLDGKPAATDPENARGTIDFWKETPVTSDTLRKQGYPVSDDYFNGVENRTAFEFIRDHLGYRLEAVDLRFTQTLRAGETFHAEIRLINRGFSTMINPREFYFVLMNDAGEFVEIPTGFNGQRLQPCHPGDCARTPIIHSISVDFCMPQTLSPGNWNLYLWIPDKRNRYQSDYAVRLASSTPWTERLGRGMNTLAEVQIQPGEVVCKGTASSSDGKSVYAENTVTVHYDGLRPTDPDGRNALRNPERGLRLEIGMGQIESDPVKHGPNSSQWPFMRYPEDGVTIGQAYCYLTQFYNTAISEEKLQAIEHDFAVLRSLGHGEKFLLRFAYEFDGVTHGPTAEQIVRHMEQLKPVLDRNWDVIYVIQTGWVGLWGEFHTSIEGIDKDPAAQAKVLEGALKILPENRFTMMRCMRYKESCLKHLNLFREITSQTAFSQNPEAKIGFFNDGTLANYWDGGTFWDPPYAAPGNHEFDYLVREAPFIPVDGELFWGTESSCTPHKDDPTKPFHGLDLTWSSGEKAMERFRLHHYSTFSYVHSFHGLEIDFKKPVYGCIDAWKDTPVTAEQLAEKHLPYSPAYFEGVDHRTAFEYIRDHLGYRLEAQECSFDNLIRHGQDFHADLSLINRGFATVINPRICYFVLCHGSGKVYEIPTHVNAQSFQPFQPGDPAYMPLVHHVTVQITIPEDLPGGAWTLGFWMPDEAESLRYRADYSIRLANNGEWYNIDGRGVNKLGTVFLI